MISQGTTDYWVRLAADRPRIYSSSVQINEAVVKGEAPVAINADTTACGAAQQETPLKRLYPPEGSGVTPIPLMLAKNPPHPNAARLFVNRHLSKDGQTVRRQARCDISPRADVSEPVGDSAGKGPASTSHRRTTCCRCNRTGSKSRTATTAGDPSGEQTRGRCDRATDQDVW